MLRRLCVLTALFVVNVAMAAVDVNKASAADLDGLSGVGPATTQLILDERKKGEFRNWDDLMKRVKGIGDARASKLSQAGLTVGGASYNKGKVKDKEKDKSRALNAPGKASSDKDKAATAAPVMTPAAVVPVKKAAELGSGSR